MRKMTTRKLVRTWQLDFSAEPGTLVDDSRTAASFREHLEVRLSAAQTADVERMIRAYRGTAWASWMHGGLYPVRDTASSSDPLAQPLRYNPVFRFDRISRITGRNLDAHRA